MPNRSTMKIVRVNCKLNSRPVCALVGSTHTVCGKNTEYFLFFIFFIKSKMTRSSKKRKKVKPNQFHIIQVKYVSTCITLDLPIELCYDVCHRKKYIFTKKSSKPEKRHKYLHATNRCKQLWDNKWLERNNVTSGLLKYHNRVRNYLGIQPGILILEEKISNKKGGNLCDFEGSAAVLLHGYVSGGLSTRRLALATCSVVRCCHRSNRALVRSRSRLLL